MKKIILFLLIFVFCLFSGCTGYNEIERGYLVTAIGISKTDDKTALYLEAVTSTDLTDKKSERCILSNSGNSLSEAFNALKSQLIKPLYFEQLGTVIFDNTPNSSDIAFLNCLPKINHGAYVVKSDSVELIFKTDFSDSILGYDIIGLIKTNFKEHKALNQFYQLKANKSIYPIVNSDGNSFVISDVEE